MNLRMTTASGAAAATAAIDHGETGADGRDRKRSVGTTKNGRIGVSPPRATVVIAEEHDHPGLLLTLMTFGSLEGA
jgi:hypothetical protein